MKKEVKEVLKELRDPRRPPNGFPVIDVPQ